MCMLSVYHALGDLIDQIMAHVRADNLIITAELHRQTKVQYHCITGYIIAINGMVKS